MIQKSVDFFHTFLNALNKEHLFVYNKSIMIQLRGMQMHRFLMKVLHEKQPVEIIYVSDKQNITQRTILVHEMNPNYIRAYCFLRKQNRLFKLDNILSVFPIKQKEPYIS